MADFDKHVQKNDWSDKIKDYEVSDGLGINQEIEPKVKPKADSKINSKPDATSPKPVSKNPLNPALVLPLPDNRSLSMKVTLYCRFYSAMKQGAPSFKEAMQEALSGDFMESQMVHGAVGPKGPTSPLDRGILFHAALEVTDFSLTEQDYRKLLSQKAQELALTPSAEEITFLAGKALTLQNSAIGQELTEVLSMENSIVRREWPFWLRLEKDEFDFGPITLSGTMDLFFVNKSGLGRVVDYKLAKTSHGEAYNKQIELYSLAVKKAGFKGKIKTNIWFSGN
jgi:ATP-dependent exoDNAse (exonuclease V) beta subunit